MRLREDQVERADGSKGIYGVVDKVDFALVIPVMDNCVFMVEQYRYTVGGRFVEFPQGTWEQKPDAEMITVAHGELREETGLRAATMEPLGVLYPLYGLASHRMHVFLATDLEQGAQELSPEEQDLTVSKVKVQDLQDMILSGVIQDSGTVAAYGLWRMKYPASVT